MKNILLALLMIISLNAAAQKEFSWDGIKTIETTRLTRQISNHTSVYKETHEIKISNGFITIDDDYYKCTRWFEVETKKGFVSIVASSFGTDITKITINLSKNQKKVLSVVVEYNDDEKDLTMFEY